MDRLEGVDVKVSGFRGGLAPMPAPASRKPDSTTRQPERGSPTGATVRYPKFLSFQGESSSGLVPLGDCTVHTSVQDWYRRFNVRVLHRPWLRSEAACRMSQAEPGIDSTTWHREREDGWTSTGCSAQNHDIPQYSPSRPISNKHGSIRPYHPPPALVRYTARVDKNRCLSPHRAIPRNLRAG